MKREEKTIKKKKKKRKERFFFLFLFLFLFFSSSFLLFSSSTRLGQGISCSPFIPLRSKNSCQEEMAMVEIHDDPVTIPIQHSTMMVVPKKQNKKGKTRIFSFHKIICRLCQEMERKATKKKEIERGRRAGTYLDLRRYQLLQ